MDQLLKGSLKNIILQYEEARNSETKAVLDYVLNELAIGSLVQRKDSGKWIVKPLKDRFKCWDVVRVIVKELAYLKFINLNRNDEKNSVRHMITLYCEKNSMSLSEKEVQFIHDKAIEIFGILYGQKIAQGDIQLLG